MSNERLRVGVIGCGTVAQAMHLPHLVELDHLFELRALADVHEPTLQEMGRLYGVPRLFIRAGELLDEPLDAVLLLTPGSHAPLALEAAGRGLHIFVEKPLCYTLEEADEIRGAVEATGVTLMVGYMKRYDPGYRYGQQAVAQLDDVRLVEVHTLHPMSQWYWRHYRLRRGPGYAPVELPPDRGEDTGGQSSLAGGELELIHQALEGRREPELVAAYNVLVSSMVHDINALRGLFGRPRRVAHTEVWRGGTSMSTVLEFQPGLRAVYSWCYLPELRHYREDIGVYASGGRVTIRFPSPFLRSAPTEVIVEGMEGEAAFEKRVTASYHEAFRLELETFHRSVVQRQPPLTDWADAREDLEVIRAMVRAAGRGKGVQV